MLVRLVKVGRKQARLYLDWGCDDSGFYTRGISIPCYKKKCRLYTDVLFGLVVVAKVDPLDFFGLARMQLWELFCISNSHCHLP